MCFCPGDGSALCEDMKDFAHNYIDYGNMAKQLTPETNRVQHWSKIIETKYIHSILTRHIYIKNTHAQKKTSKHI